MIDPAILQSLIEKASVPAISYAYVGPSDTRPYAFRVEARSFGIKSKDPGDMRDVKANTVDNDTIFPASSLSKQVFAYLVLKLAEQGVLGERGIDEPLINLLEYERFKVDGVYPDKARKITARHVLSHTTCLPNWALGFKENPDKAELRFDPNSSLGEGFSYSGEAFLYLQKAIEAKTGKSLNDLAKEYVFNPLGMTHSSYIPYTSDDENAVKVHSRLGEPKDIYRGNPEQNAAGSLVTTATDYAKFISGWLSHSSDFFPESFTRHDKTNTETLGCGLGWHIHGDIAWQHGANSNTRSFVMINLRTKKASVFFTNSENGESIISQVLESISSSKEQKDLQEILTALGYEQSDEPGWVETLEGDLLKKEGKMAEAEEKYIEAAAAAKDSKASEATQRRLEWFQATLLQQKESRAEFTTPLDKFIGDYDYGTKVFVRHNNLIQVVDGKEIELSRISDNEFVSPDLKYKVQFKEGGMDVLFLKSSEPVSLNKRKEDVPLEKDISSESPGDITLPPAQIIIQGLQEKTNQSPFTEKFCAGFDTSMLSSITFQDILDKYQEYSKKLPSEQQQQLENIFWEQVKAIGGTPIIENREDGNCEVYFLFPREQIEDSKESPGDKKDLYLQGDFHGYGTTDNKAKLDRLEGTGIMLRKDTIPVDSLVAYKYIQVEPSHRDKKPTPELPPFFEGRDGFTERGSKMDFPEIPHQVLSDDHGTHRYTWEIGIKIDEEKVFKVNADPRISHMDGKVTDWPRLLSDSDSTGNRHFTHFTTLYSTKDGELTTCDADVTRSYPNDLRDTDDSSPYSNFTRAIQVFKPSSGNIDNIVIVNDGNAYLIQGMMDNLESMVGQGSLSPNTALIFINTLPGLADTCEIDDPKAKFSGMGERVIDYEHKIEDYVDFIQNTLFKHLDSDEFKIPRDPANRVMIGSSLSGTAALRIGLEHPDLFGGIIVQSPSPSNRGILSEVPPRSSTQPAIHLSCGVFEHPSYAAANDNLSYARELSGKLGIPLHPGRHGHSFLGWTEAIVHSLPATLSQMHSAKHALDKHSRLASPMGPARSIHSSAVTSDSSKPMETSKSEPPSVTERFR